MRRPLPASLLPGPPLRALSFLPIVITAAPTHHRAILFMIVAAVCWSSGGFLVRQLSITDAWEIVFWRSLFMAAFVAGVLLVIHGRRMPRAVAAVGWPGVMSGAFLAGTFFFLKARSKHHELDATGSPDTPVKDPDQLVKLRLNRRRVAVLRML